eukprot:400533_1
MDMDIVLSKKLDMALDDVDSVASSRDRQTSKKRFIAKNNMKRRNRSPITRYEAPVSSNNVRQSRLKVTICSKSVAQLNESPPKRRKIAINFSGKSASSHQSSTSAVLPSQFHKSSTSSAYHSLLNSYSNNFANPNSKPTVARLLRVRSAPCDGMGACLVTVKKRGVPRTVLPRDVHGVVFTPIAKSCSESGYVKQGLRCSDDNSYKNHPKLRLVLPRCYSIFLIFSNDDNRCIDEHIMHGFYKFGGQARDEDSRVGSSGLYEQASLEHATRVVLTEKVNGKGFNVTAFNFRGETYLFGGSKTEHHVLRLGHLNEDVKHLDRTHFAYHMWIAFIWKFNSLSASNRHIFLSELSGEQSNVATDFRRVGNISTGSTWCHWLEVTPSRSCSLGSCQIWDRSTGKILCATILF